MNLAEFLDYRTECPMCQTKLSTGFVSDRRQIIRYEDNRFNVQFPLDSLKDGEKDYRCIYSFGMTDQSFCMDFATKDGSLLERSTPLFLIKRFQELHQNLKVYKFFRGCSMCRLYAYGSQNFEVDFPTATFSDLRVWSEKGLLSSPVEDGHRVYSLTNFLSEGRSEVNIWKTDDIKTLYGYWELVPNNADFLKMNTIVSLSNPKETAARLSKLLIFS